MLTLLQIYRVHFHLNAHEMMLMSVNMFYFEFNLSGFKVDFCVIRFEGRKATEAVPMVSVPLIRYLIKPTVA